VQVYPVTVIMAFTGVVPRRSGIDPHVVGAFAAVYLVWGSTYLAIKVAITSLPPFTMVAMRSFVAGAVLYAWGRWRGAAPPTAAEWRHGVLVGALLFGVGHGGLGWAEQRVPSGVASLFIATLPVWMTLLQGFTDRATAISARTLLGVIGGSLGMLVLVGPRAFLGGDPIDPVGAAVLVLAALAWSVGSAVARRRRPTTSLTVGTGSYLLAGGALLGVLALVSGETRRLDLAAVTSSSVVALGYLIVFGSVVTFGAYSWLLRRQPLSIVSTYAFVNPIVALFVGWALGGEILNARILTAAVFVVAAVVLILTGAAERPAPAPTTAPPTRASPWQAERIPVGEGNGP
jgi:drug/metabolite transporter (DMT)-like permease